MGAVGGKNHELRNYSRDLRIKIPFETPKPEQHICDHLPSNALYVNLPEPRNFGSWTISLQDNTVKRVKGLLKFDKNVYIDIGHHSSGEREYYCPHSAKFFTEKEMKSMIDSIVIVATYYQGGMKNDFTVIEELCVSPNKVILSNVTCLLSVSTPHLFPSVFGNVQVVINAMSGEQLKYAFPSKEIINIPVHDFENNEDTFKILDKIHTRMWNAIQDGTVIVHCMAGFHRAAFIVVSHFIWRHYYLKQSFIPCEVPLIYENLAKIRHGVLALDFGPILEAYVSWLKNTSLSSS